MNGFSFRGSNGWVMVILMTGLLMSAFAYSATPTYRFSGDTAHYVGAARSLADGLGYTVSGVRETKFPPGFSVMLLPAAWAFGGDFYAMSLWSAMLAGLVLPATWIMLRRRGEPLALEISLGTSLCVPMLVLATGNPMSEPVFLALSMCLLAWADGWESESIHARSIHNLLLGGALVVAVASTRIIGVAGFVAITCVIVVRVRRKTASAWDFLPVLMGLGYLAWWATWSAFLNPVPGDTGPTGGYGSLLALASPSNPDLGTAGFGALFARLTHNVLVHTAQVGELLVQAPWLSPKLYSPVIAVGALVAIGAAKQFAQHGYMHVIFFVASLGVVAVWPYTEKRFLLPLFPLFCLYILEGGRTLIAFSERRWERVNRGIALLSIIAVALGVIDILRDEESPGRQGYVFLAIWVLMLAVSLATTRFPAIIGFATSILRSPRFAVCILAAFCIVGLYRAVPLVATAKQGHLPTESTEEALRQASEWIANNTPRSSSVASTWSERLSFATGRQGVQLPVTSDSVRLVTFARQSDPDFVVVLADPPYPYVQPSDSARFALLLLNDPDGWARVANLPRATVYAARR